MIFGIAKWPYGSGNQGQHGAPKSRSLIRVAMIYLRRRTPSRRPQFLISQCALQLKRLARVYTVALREDLVILLERRHRMLFIKNNNNTGIRGIDSRIISNGKERDVEQSREKS